MARRYAAVGNTSEDNIGLVTGAISTLATYTKNTNTVAYNHQPWYHLYLPILGLTTIALVLIVLVIVIVICCCLLKKQKKFASSLQQVTIHPTPKPDVKSAMLVQPGLTLNTLCMGQQTPLQFSKMKTPGLLERRGSTPQSLTIKLSPKRDPRPDFITQESPTAEYLQTSSRSLNCQQLSRSLDNVHLLYEEFWDIPMNHPSKVTVAGSGTKNRYRTIIPNESTRVTIPSVDEDPLNEYINANYIRGYGDDAKTYIATQGPMTHTLEDFWNMCWSERISIIVMITKLSEHEKVKCASYIPMDDKSVRHAGLEVVVLDTQLKDGYTVRQLRVQDVDKVQYIKHFWYTAWPDHQTPASPDQLLNLVCEVESCRLNGRPSSSSSCSPVVVHCSAGIGRTGCFIGTTIGMKQLQVEQCVDVLHIVCKMRQDRGGMVQTNEQYEFLYRALKAFSERDDNDNMKSK